MSTMNKEIKFPESDTYLFLDGPVGKLELLVSPAATVKNQYAIICHPHPLFQGTMNNKVVHTLHKALHSCGFNTIRFNYRGVGRSEGKYGDSIGEIADLRSIVSWLQNQKPNCKILLAGFSFGAYIALNISKEIECVQLISIAPAVPNQDYVNAMPVNCPWLIIQGDADEVIPPKKVFDFIDNLDNKPDLIVFPKTSHFFHGKLIELRETLIEYLEKHQY